MIIIMTEDASTSQVKKVTEKLRSFDLKVHPSLGDGQAVLGVIGDTHFLPDDQIQVLPGVERITRISKPYKLASRAFRKEDSLIPVGCNGNSKKAVVLVGDGNITIMAGPCAIESRDQILKTAIAVKKAGAHILRGGAFKPRTAPYEFQGLGEQGLKFMREAGNKTGMPIVTEVLDPRDVPLVAKYADMLQIGTRNMQNFMLLRECGKVNKPILLKRGMTATYTEWLLAAEYIMLEGNHRVILCERGIRTFVTDTRNTLDISAIPVMKELTHLPIIIDPSHSTGKRSIVAPVTRSAIAAGAHGILIDVHVDPDKALVDGAQTIGVEDFEHLMKDIKQLARVFGKKI